jgi:hypothetical protein
MMERKNFISEDDPESINIRFLPVTVTSTGGAFNTRSKSYSRLIHGRIEDDIRESLRKHAEKSFSSEILDPIRLELLDLLSYTPCSEFYRYVRFPLMLEIDGTEWKIEQDGRIDCLFKKKIDYIEVKVKISKSEE